MKNSRFSRFADWYPHYCLRNYPRLDEQAEEGRKRFQHVDTESRLSLYLPERLKTRTVQEPVSFSAPRRRPVRPVRPVRPGRQFQVRVQEALRHIAAIRNTIDPEGPALPGSADAALAFAWTH